MRSAIRGDFERLAARRGAQELLSIPEEDVEPPAPPEELAEDAAMPVETPAEPPRSWVGRWFGR
jgi:hypothetical protein